MWIIPDRTSQLSFPWTYCRHAFLRAINRASLAEEKFKYYDAHFPHGFYHDDEGDMRPSLTIKSFTLCLVCMRVLQCCGGRKDSKYAPYVHRSGSGIYKQMLQRVVEKRKSRHGTCRWKCERGKRAEISGGSIKSLEHLKECRKIKKIEDKHELKTFDVLRWHLTEKCTSEKGVTALAPSCRLIKTFYPPPNDLKVWSQSRQNRKPAGSRGNTKDFWSR